MLQKLAPMHVTKIVRFDWSAAFVSFWYKKLGWNTAVFYSVQGSCARFLGVCHLLKIISLTEAQSVNRRVKLESSGGMQTALWRRSPANRSSPSKCCCMETISPSRSLITSCSDAISSSMSRSMDDIDEELVSQAFGWDPETWSTLPTGCVPLFPPWLMLSYSTKSHLLMCTLWSSDNIQ